MLLDDVSQTLHVADESIKRAIFNIDDEDDKIYLETLGINEAEKQAVIQLASKPKHKIDPVVSYLVAATNGLVYKHLIGSLEEYPIPEIRIPHGCGETLLDVGCSWGRWSISAAKKGYRVVGIDPSLGAVMAARRVARQLDLKIKYVVGDARFLPFKAATFERVFSYSVLQHFSRENAAQSVKEIGRAIKSGGNALVQMPNVLGARCLYHQARRKFREASEFEVRYWSIPSLRKLFSSYIGSTDITADCFLGIGLQYSDLRMMPITHKAAILTSELLRKVSNIAYPITYLADSVYVSSVKL
ncbi:MAG: class I SAM-dependent methyltransferase [Blastocatellia bacterium]